MQYPQTGKPPLPAMTVCALVEERIRCWLALDKDPTSRKQVQELARKANNDHVTAAELLDAFCQDIAFGTAGLRSKMSPGFNRMNRVTVQLASQGVAQYLSQRGAKAIVIGCDHRHNSQVFADIAAQCMKTVGINVLSFSSVVPTPLVPFAVEREHADFGIMITASHNPAADNGYKVYGPNACQIVSPTDKDISKLIVAQNYSLWELGEGLEVEDIYERTCSAYVESNLALYSPLLRPSLPSTQIAYTAMHGVGWKIVERLLNSINQSSSHLIPVPSQVDPDADFPTVAFPNPEEGRETLQEAITFAERAGLKVIFANDPDADRFNCAEQRGDGEWHIFTGNEMAVIFADYLWRQRAVLFPHARDFAMVKSCVSSKLLCAMGQKEGFQVLETLTGFKYLSNTSQQVEEDSQGRTKILLAYEEAIGYMVNTAVWDKDGISALLLMKIILDKLSSEGTLLEEHLASLYRRYGYFVQYNSYYSCQPSSRSPGIFQRLRKNLAALLATDNPDLTGSCSLEIPNAEGVRIESIKDYPGTTMITLYLDKKGLSWVTLRASGTEPKIKFYSELCCDYEERDAVDQTLHSTTDQICEWLLEPKRNDLRRKDL